jgi:predicted DNA-binding ribbon-helix-helix protein
MGNGQVSSRNKKLKGDFHSITVRTAQYDKIKEYAEENNIYIVQVLEEMFYNFFGKDEHQGR